MKLLVKFLALTVVLCLMMSSCSLLINTGSVTDPGNDTTQVQGDTNTGGNNTGGNTSGGGTPSGGAADSGTSGSGTTGGSSGGDKILPEDCTLHTDTDNNGFCDSCDISVIVCFDLYALNDLHGKMLADDRQPGIASLSTYLKYRQEENPNTVVLSSGDMWQGSSESNLTKGMMMTEWMNYIGFSSMTLGNHEFDWGSEYILKNAETADFPMLAINIYDSETDERVEYCRPSVVLDYGEVQIGIIGAIGDCHSSISGEYNTDFYFLTGSDLTALVQEESERLREEEGVDYIIYSFHADTSEYDRALSRGGYVDVVFEAHTHQTYATTDIYGVYHIQNGGENSNISHLRVNINFANGNNSTVIGHTISSSVYSTYDEDGIIDELTDKYADELAAANEVLGTLTRTVYSDELLRLSAQLYYEKAVEKWGGDYDIALGGGFFSARSPYNLSAGEVKYSDLQAILPFDNTLVLCSVKGQDLYDKFFYTSNSRYYIYYEEYGESIKDSLDPDATYYIITDTYTSTYAYNNLTEIERYTEGVYARDLIAEYIKAGLLK